MRYIRYTIDGVTAYGIVDNNLVQELTAPPWSDPERTGHTFYLGDVVLQAPCQPGKVVCVGLNYRDHVQEFGKVVPDEPVLFLKPGTAVTGTGTDIVYPAMSRQVDYEAELGVVIGRRIRGAKPEAIRESVFGYTCGNDVTARDLQRRDGQWTRAKSFDTFCPLGPWIVTGIDPGNLNIRLIHNGVVKQDSTTAKMIFPVDRLISFISEVMTLEPGDVILTGTPSGVGAVNPGDEVAVEIELIGTLKNRIR